MRKIVVAVLFVLLTGVFVKSVFSSDVKAQNKEKCLAVIKIQGPLYSMSTESITGRTSGADEIMRQIVLARKDDSVAGVLLRIDSPGGSATAAEEISVEIAKLKASGKVVVTSMGDMAASAGYWLASSSDYVFANPSTLTGSIGVYVPYMNIEELYKKIGISQDKIKSGKYKDMLSAERTMTADEKQIVQTMVDEIYSSFVKQVSQGRGLSEEEVRKLADGRVYTGRQAKELKLVDELGNYYDALLFTAKKSGIEGEPKIKEYQAPFSWHSLLKMEISKQFMGFFGFVPENSLSQKGFY